MDRGYPGVAGSPVRPYVEFAVNVNSDIWLNLTFLDRNRVLATPVTITYRIDDLTTDNLVLGWTSVTPTGPTLSLNIPASINVIQSDIGQSSQLNQVTVTATFSDGSQTQSVHIYELIAIQLVGGPTAGSCP